MSIGFLDLPIDHLEIRIRTCNTLKNYGIGNIRELMEFLAGYEISGIRALRGIAL